MPAFKNGRYILNSKCVSVLIDLYGGHKLLLLPQHCALLVPVFLHIICQGPTVTWGTFSHLGWFEYLSL